MALTLEEKTEIIQESRVHETDTGLLMLVGQRRRLLAYSSKKDPDRYRTLIAKLGLRH